MIVYNDSICETPSSIQVVTSSVCNSGPGIFPNSYSEGIYSGYTVVYKLGCGSDCGTTLQCNLSGSSYDYATCQSTQYGTSFLYYDVSAYGIDPTNPTISVDVYIDNLCSIRAAGFTSTASLTSGTCGTVGTGYGLGGQFVKCIFCFRWSWM